MFHDLQHFTAMESLFNLLSVLVILYSFIILWRGLRNFRDPNFIGILMAGLAGRIPAKYQVMGPLCYTHATRATVYVHHATVSMIWLQFVGSSKDLSLQGIVNFGYETCEEVL